MTETVDLSSLLKGDGKALMSIVMERLAAAGLPRTSRYNGGELTGWTESYGNTGFSVAKYAPNGPITVYKGPGQLRFNVVVSGKAAGLDYRHDVPLIGGDYGHEPINPEQLHPRIAKVFRDLGFVVRHVASSGFQMMWDDDCDFTVYTDWPSA